MSIIPFYGVDHPDLFAIERAAMDRPGLVLQRLNRLLPAGVVADIGAGDGFTAEHLTSSERRIVAVEPAWGMIDLGRRLPWVRADAEALPFREGYLDGAYATWAYFFSRGPLDPAPGIEELHRTVKPGGPLVVVDNAGGDEFCSLSSKDISADPRFWRGQGFGVEVVDTVFEFETTTDAWRLLDFYFEGIGPAPPTRFTYRVALFIGASRGPS